MKTKKQTQFECQICHQIFFQKSLLSKHTQIGKHNNIGAPKTLKQRKKSIKSTKHNQKNLLIENPVGIFYLINAFVCFVCFRLLWSPAILRRHFLNNHKHQITFECKKCDHLCFQYKDLQVHIQNEHKQTNDFFVCFDCSQSFVSEIQLKQHIKRNHKNKDGEEKVHIKQHLQKFHPLRKKAYQCLKCPKQFSYKFCLKRHIKTVHVNLITCTICLQFFDEKIQLEQHTQKKHNEKLTFQCHKCVSQYTRKTSLNRHIRMVHEFTCTVCLQDFTEKIQLKQHTQEKHKRKETFQCHKCFSSYKNNSSLKKHIQMVHEFTCTVCLQNFDENIQLIQHIQTQHADKKEVLYCQNCSKQFTKIDIFNRHILNFHEKFTCTDCKHIFDGKKQLRQHQQLNKHHKFADELVKKIGCSFCTKRFNHNLYLNRHIKLVHQNIKTCVCLLCQQKFGRNFQLKNHILHVHNKLFQCFVCLQRFADPKECIKHLKKTHIFYECYLCRKIYYRKDYFKRHMKCLHITI